MNTYYIKTTNLNLKILDELIDTILIIKLHRIYYNDLTTYMSEINRNIK